MQGVSEAALAGTWKLMLAALVSVSRYHFTSLAVFFSTQLSASPSETVVEASLVFSRLLTYQSRDVIPLSFIPPTNTQSGSVPVLEITGTTAVTPPLVSMVEKSM